MSFASNALTLGDPKLVDWLFAKTEICPETIIHADGLTVLQAAARFSNLQMLLLVLDRATDVNTRNADELPPLAELLLNSRMVAADLGRAYEGFIECGAEPNPMVPAPLLLNRNIDGQVPLSFVLKCREIDAQRGAAKKLGQLCDRQYQLRFDLCHTETARAENGMALNDLVASYNEDKVTRNVEIASSDATLRAKLLPSSDPESEKRTITQED